MPRLGFLGATLFAATLGSLVYVSPAMGSEEAEALEKLAVEIEAALPDPLGDLKRTRAPEAEAERFDDVSVPRTHPTYPTAARSRPHTSGSNRATSLGDAAGSRVITSVR